MRRLLLALIAVSFTVQASTTVFTTCTAGDITATPCPGDLFLSTGLEGPNYFVSAFAQASESVGDILILSEATGEYMFCQNCGPEPILSALAQATANDTDYTNGPVRSGFVKITAGIDSLHGNPYTGWSIIDGPYTYVNCLPGFSSGAEGCHGTVTVPFQLGIPFQVSAYAPSTPGGVHLMPGDSGHGTGEQVTVTFSLFEADGKTPVAFFAVPEPSTHALLVVAFGLLAFVRRIRHLH